MSNSNKEDPLHFFADIAIGRADDTNAAAASTTNNNDTNTLDTTTPKVDNTTTIASRTRSGGRKKNDNNNKMRQESTPYVEQQDTYGDTDTLIDTGRDVDLAPEGGAYDSHLTQRVDTPGRRKRSRSTKRRSKLFPRLDVEIEDEDVAQQPANNEEEEDGGLAIDSSDTARTRRRGNQVLKNAQRLLDRRNQIKYMLPTKQASQLCNPDNYTCYMGTGLQTLAHMHCISGYFLNTEFMSDINDDNFNKCGVVALAFHTILRRIMNNERRLRQGINVREFKTVVDFSTSLFPTGQRDVMEFLTYFISTLHESTADISGRSRLSDVFSGNIVSTTVCPDPQCLHSRDTTESSCGLNLEIDPAAGDNEDALEMCLRKFCAPETLDQNNTTECDACKNRVQQTRSMKYNAPPILFISFKRFQVIDRTGRRRRTRKNGIKLGFPMTLDMAEFAPPSSSVGNNHLYDLFAVINHDGTTLESGHYFLYIKIDDVWNVYNDGAPISQITESQVVTDKAYALVYVKQSEFNRLIPSPDTQHIVGTIRPPRQAASISTRQQKKTPAKTSVSASHPRPQRAAQKKTPRAKVSSQSKKRSSSNTTADKSSTAGARKKRKTSSVSSQLNKRASDSNTTAAPKRKKRRTQQSWKRFKEIEDDKKMQDEKKRGEQVPSSYEYLFYLPLPDGMEIEEERTKMPHGNKYSCRNKICTKGASYKGKEGEKELCGGCATEVRQHRRKLEFDKEFQFVDGFDNELAKINAHIHDSHPDDYTTILQRENGQYTCELKQQGMHSIFGMHTATPSDSALVRQCLCILYDADTDANMCRRNQLEDYLGKRERESERVSDVPSVKEFFQELAFWLFNKYYDEYKTDEDINNRLRTILGYLEDPTQLHKLWDGEKFEYQGINCAKEELDVRQQFECLNCLYDENGGIRSTFYLSYGQKKKMIAAIDAISMAFERDVKHHSSARSRTWVDREDDVKAFKKWLKLQRDILSCENDDDLTLTQLVMEFKRQVQATIDEINTEIEDATRRRQQDDTTHPAVAHVQECITRGNPPPNYEKYMKDTIGDNIKTTQNQYKQDINQLQETAFYKKLKDAQNNNQAKDPRIDVTLCKIELAYHNEKNANRWFRNKFRRVEWEGVCPFTNEEYETAGMKRPRFIGDIYRRLLVRLAKECMMEGCSIKPSDYDRAKQLYGFHLHHYINSGPRISNLTEDIDKMSEEAKKNCVVFCNGCHNFKEQDNVYSIPLNKLQNQLIYDEGDEHVTGRELVLDFDLVVVILKLFVVGGFRSGSATRCTPDILRSIFFDHFGILFDDTVDYNVDDMFNNLDDDDQCKRLVNSAILGALKKRSKKCAKPECKMGFMNISSFHSTVIHLDHTEGKEFKGAYLHRKQIVVLLNEVGRYLGATCAFCHGEQPRSCKERRTWMSS